MDVVHFVLTRAGYDELLRRQGRVPSPLWLNSDVLTDEALFDLRSQGIEVSCFVHRIDPADQLAIQDAVDTIGQHHEGLPIQIADA